MHTDWLMNWLTTMALFVLAMGLAMVPPFIFALGLIVEMVQNVTDLFISNPFESAMLAMLLTLFFWVLGFVTAIPRLMKYYRKRNSTSA